MPVLELLTAALAKTVASKVVDGSVKAIRRRLEKPEARTAFDAAVQEALEEALPEFLPESHEEDESLGDHLKDLLEGFLASDAVVDELTNLIDTRVDGEFDHQAVLRQFEEEHDRPRLDGFDLVGFLRGFVDAFEHAAAHKPALQGVIRLRLARANLAANLRAADATERVADELSELRTDVIGLLQGAIEAPRVQILQVVADRGLLPALNGYELLVSALQGEGYDVVADPFANRVEITGAELADEKALPPASLVHLSGMAEKLRRAVVDQTPTADELDALDERYREHLIRWFGHLAFQGMMRAPRPIVLPLEEVYVELRAVAEVPEAADAFSVEERRLLLELEERDPEGRPDRDRLTDDERELRGQLDALRRERWSRTLPERKSIAEAVHRVDQRAFVVLGDPGSGKTTLLHYLALVYARGAETAAERLGIAVPDADRLPIFVPLAAFDDMRRKHDGLTLRDFLALYYDTRRGLPGLGPLFERAIRTGRALVLLDGLDEVLDVQTRRYVADQVSALMGEWTPAGVRFVLSSRVVGYREAPVSGQASTLTVLDFGAREIEVFVRQWARAFESWAAGGQSPEAARLARTLERDLMEDVRSNPSVQRLAANPLMLTMLALLRRQVGRLPHRRIQLYESYVGTLLENWIEARSYGAREGSIERLERHQAENVLIPLALWLQAEKPSGTAGRVEVHRKLTDVYLEEEGLTRDGAGLPRVREAESKAERFLRDMRQMTGLIVERGHDAFGFLHLTFQEFFAGRALAQKDDASRWEVICRHLHNPRWREPIMLCAGRLGVAENRRAQVMSLVRSILEHEDATEGDLRRNLQLALAIACDDVYLEPLLIDRLVETAVGCVPSGVHAIDRALMGYLAQLVSNESADVDTCFGPFFESKDVRLRRAAVSALGRFARITGVRELLLKLLEDDDLDVLSATMNALASLLGRDETARGAILEKLKDNYWTVRKSAVSALASLLGRDETVREALFEKLKDDQFDVRGAAVGALASLLGRDETVREALFEKLKDDDFDVRRSTVSALASLLGRDKTVRTALIEKLKDRDNSVRRSAVTALTSLLGHDEIVREALIEKLRDESHDVRESAVIALGSLVGQDETVREALFERLDDDVLQVPLKVVEALLPFLSKEPGYWPRVRPWLGAAATVGYDRIISTKGWLRRLHNTEWEHRFLGEFVPVIGECAARDPSLRAELLEQLTDDRASARGGAALVLLASPNAITPDVVAKVLAAVDDRRGLESYPARLTAASFLLNRNETSAASVDLCLEALDYGPQPWEHLVQSREIRKQAALVLGKLEPLESNQRAYDKLLHVMKHDEDAEVRDAAYGALVRLARARELGETGRQG